MAVLGLSHSDSSSDIVSNTMGDQRYSAAVRRKLRVVLRVYRASYPSYLASYFPAPSTPGPSSS